MPELVPTVLYQDDQVLVVNKPAGLLVHRGWANDRHTLMTWSRRTFGPDARPVHRLDRATSGALLLCFGAEATALLQAQFGAGTIVKNYLTFTRGITPEKGLIDHGLRKSKLHERRPATTAIRRLGEFERYSLLEARPFSGRQHQIRKHLKHISHPVIGDTRYGKGEHNRKFRAEFSLHRLCLHASRLCFVHPRTSLAHTVCAPLPDDLAAPFERLGLLAAALDATTGSVWAPGPTDLPVLCRDEPAADPLATSPASG
jgi:tRNA pseudouridine65 synthase